MKKLDLTVYAQYGSEVPSDAKQRARATFANSLLASFGGSVERAQGAHDDYYLGRAYQSRERADRERAAPWKDAWTKAFRAVALEEPVYFALDDNCFDVSFTEEEDESGKP